MTFVFECLLVEPLALNLPLVQLLFTLKLPVIIAQRVAFVEHFHSLFFVEQTNDYAIILLL